MLAIDFLQDVFFALWFFIPAALGNVTPILVAKASWPPLKKWTTPIDMGRTFRGKRVFGEHKTWRGLLTGMIVSTLTLALQQVLFGQAPFLHDWLQGFDFAQLPTLIVGPLFGLGALGGDAIKSFFKRQRGVPPGESWYPFDQLDLPIGALVATWPFVHYSLMQAVFLVLIGWASQLIWTYIGFRLHFKDKPI